jgi:hypothetical protein
MSRDTTYMSRDTTNMSRETTPMSHNSLWITVYLSIINLCFWTGGM